jgi:hypothetical protein
VLKFIQSSYQRRYVPTFAPLISCSSSQELWKYLRISQSLYSHMFKKLLAEILQLHRSSQSILVSKTAMEMRSIAARSDLGLEPRTPKRQSFIRAVLSEKKRKSRDNPVLRSDPFRYGDPNPLDCHPYFSDKHPDYIVRPHTVQRPLSFPVLNPTPGSPSLSIYDQDDLDAYRSQGFVPRLLRVDSLVAILEFFNGNTLSRAMANSLQPARKPPGIPCRQQTPPVNSLFFSSRFRFYSSIILYMN